MVFIKKKKWPCRSVGTGDKEERRGEEIGKEKRRDSSRRSLKTTSLQDKEQVFA